MPQKKENSENLLKVLFKNNIKNKKILLLQGVNGRKLIEITLKKRGICVFTMECYRRVFKKFNFVIEEEKWRSYQINTLVTTNAETLHQLHHIFSRNTNNKWLFSCKIIVIEKRLAEIAKKLGWTDIIIAKYANNQYLLKFIAKIR